MDLKTILLHIGHTIIPKKNNSRPGNLLLNSYIHFRNFNYNFDGYFFFWKNVHPNRFFWVLVKETHALTTFIIYQDSSHNRKEGPLVHSLQGHFGLSPVPSISGFSNISIGRMTRYSGDHFLHSFHMWDGGGESLHDPKANCPSYWEEKAIRTTLRRLTCIFRT